MGEKKYEVLDNFGHLIARDMDIHTALLLMEAYCGKYYMESVELTLKEMANAVCKEA